MMTVRSMLMSTAAAVVIIPAIFVGGPVSAAVAEAPTASGDAATGEDIVVTAQKRKQMLIDVPQSVTVVSGATLERQQATNFEDYLKLVPGLQLSQDTPG